MARKVTESYLTLRRVEEQGDLAEDGETLDEEARNVLNQLDEEINYDQVDADVSMQVEEIVAKDLEPLQAEPDFVLTNNDITKFLEGIQDPDFDDPWDKSMPNKKKPSVANKTACTLKAGSMQPRSICKKRHISCIQSDHWLSTIL